MLSTLLKQLSEKWTPHAYQKRAVKFLLEHAAAALFLDPGLGKTSITLAAIKFLKKKGILSKVLLIAPRRVCYQVWPKEIKNWLDFNELSYVILHGPKKEELLQQEADIYIINPEGLDWLLGVTKKKTKSGKKQIFVDIKRWKSFGFDTMVIDELSKFKNNQSDRFKALKQVIHTLSRRWGLTGSPASNGLMGLFSQCFILDEGRTFGRYITKYRSTYFDKSYNGFSWDLKQGAEELIYKRIKPLALRIGDDVLDVPKVVNNYIKVQLSDSARKIYDEFEKDLIVRLEEGKISAKNSGVRTMKCRQLVGGGVYLDQEVQALMKLPKAGKRDWVDLDDTKLLALEDLIDELQGEPLLISYDFGHELERIKKRFGKDVPYIGGGTSDKRSRELEDLWNAGNLPFLFGQPQSIAYGLNLQQAARHIAFYSLLFDFEIYDQLIRRIRRQGNKYKRIFCHHIMVENSIDDVMLNAIRIKESGQNALFAALQKKYKKVA